MPRSQLAGAVPIRRAAIKSLATYVPPRLLTNADLEKMVDTSDEWIIQRTGIRERHIVDPGVATSDLAKEAALEAIRRAGLTPADIDLIIVGTVTPDMMFPEHGVPGAGEDWREPGVGLRPVGRVFGLHVRADGGQPDGGRGRRGPTCW
jgi:hypothetical protein